MKTESATAYDAAFYQTIAERSLASARATLGILWRHYAPRSVIDVGCGAGTWLKAATELGASEIQGLEGAWLNKESAVIPFDRIKVTDLAQPVEIAGAYDLAISMEVAEHLPPERAESFVCDLTRLAKVVLFSAAIPQQEGTNHLNEQWPEYWAGLFREEDYLAFDLLRRDLWANADVDWWYAQNAIVYIEESFFRKTTFLRELTPYRVERPLSLVHPELLQAARRPGVKKILGKLLPESVSRAVAHRIR